MNLHDWIDELCDVLDIETEVDEGLVLDLARIAANDVQKTAAPVTAYLLGVAVGSTGANSEAVEALAQRPRLSPPAGTVLRMPPTPTTSTTKCPTTPRSTTAVNTLTRTNS